MDTQHDAEPCDMRNDRPPMSLHSTLNRPIVPSMSLMRRALTVSSWTLVSRILGLVRDRLWAGAQGGSVMLDCFLVAFQLPNLLRNLFGEGALAAAVVPRYVQERERDAATAELFAGLILTRLSLFLSAVAILGLAGASAALHFGAGDTVIIAALAIPQIPFLIFVCSAAIMSGILNGRRRFWVPAFAPVLLNLSLIATVGLGIDDECWYLPYAVLAGGLANVFLHLWALHRAGGVPPCATRILDEGMRERMRELVRAYLPTVLAGGVFQINTLLDTIIAKALIPGNGAVAVLYFANRLLQFPMAMIGHGVTTAAYPELAASAAKGWAYTGVGLREAVRLLSYWLLPAAIGLLVTADPVVRAIYQVGRFDESYVLRTVLATQFYAAALIPMALSRLLMRSFHAHRDQATPVRVSLAIVVANLCLNVILVQTQLAEAGIALSAACTATMGCAAYTRLLARRGVHDVLQWRGLVRPAGAALVMGAAVWALLHWWPQPVGHGSGYAALRLAAATTLGVGIYLAITGRAWLRQRRTPGKETDLSEP
jgi:putative peptidoglycan lipid II flippase